MNNFEAIAALSPLSGNEARLFSAEPLVARGEERGAARSRHWSWSDITRVSQTEAALARPRLHPPLPIQQSEVIWLAGPDFVQAWASVIEIVQTFATPSNRREIGRELTLDAWSATAGETFVACTRHWLHMHFATQALAQAAFASVMGAVRDEWAWDRDRLAAIQTLGLGINDGLSIRNRLLLRGIICSLTDDSATWPRVLREAAMRLGVSRSDFALEVKLAVNGSAPSKSKLSFRAARFHAAATMNDDAGLNSDANERALLISDH